MANRGRCRWDQGRSPPPAIPAEAKVRGSVPVGGSHNRTTPFTAAAADVPPDLAGCSRRRGKDSEMAGRPAIRQTDSLVGAGPKRRWALIHYFLP
jgi:hypothetical protein